MERLREAGVEVRLSVGRIGGVQGNRAGREGPASWYQKVNRVSKIKYFYDREGVTRTRCFVMMKPATFGSLDLQPEGGSWDIGWSSVVVRPVAARPHTGASRGYYPRPKAGRRPWFNWPASSGPRSSGAGNAWSARTPGAAPCSARSHGRPGRLPRRLPIKDRVWPGCRPTRHLDRLIRSGPRQHARVRDRAPSNSARNSASRLRCSARAQTRAAIRTSRARVLRRRRFGRDGEPGVAGGVLVLANARRMVLDQRQEMGTIGEPTIPVRPAEHDPVTQLAAMEQCPGPRPILRPDPGSTNAPAGPSRRRRSAPRSPRRPSACRGGSGADARRAPGRGIRPGHNDTTRGTWHERPHPCMARTASPITSIGTSRPTGPWTLPTLPSPGVLSMASAGQTPRRALQVG